MKLQALTSLSVGRSWIHLDPSGSLGLGVSSVQSLLQDIIGELIGCSQTQAIGSVCMLYMVTCTIDISQMLVYMPYMDPMGNE